MATVYKRRQDAWKSRAPWYIGYTDRYGRRKTCKGFTDKGETQKLAAKLEHEESLRAKGLIDPEQEELAQLKKTRIATTLKGYEVKQSKNSKKHAKQTLNRIRRIVDEAGVSTIGELTLEGVESAIGQIVDDDDLGPKTYNHYAQAINAYCNWLVATKHLTMNPLVGMERMNAEVDVRHRRRALTAEEFSKLVTSARESGIKIQGYSAEDRARVYLVAYYTGLRRKELSTLRSASFNLLADPPTLTVEAASSKRRKEDTLPIHPDLLGYLCKWLPSHSNGKPLFPKLDRKKTWLMVKKDLERVGIAYKTKAGIADFHAAGRHTHITELLRNGASLPEARELARHSDVRMTMRYTHIGLDDQAKAIQNLPSIKEPAEDDEDAWECSGSAPSGVEGQNLTSVVKTVTADDSPQTVGESSLSTEIQTLSAHDKNGGGGDRTRVPQCIHEGLYVCSRLFGVSPREAPVDRVSARLDQNGF